MGKNSAANDAKRQNAEVARRNAEQAAENARTEAENETAMRNMQGQADYANASQAYNERKWNFEADRNKQANAARDAIYDERIKVINDSSNLLTDFEAQEKQRFLEARKGVGQVDAGDTAITGAHRERALEMLGKSEDYWSSRASVAYDGAYGRIGEFGEAAPAAYNPQSYSRTNPTAAEQRGRDYVNTRTAPTTSWFTGGTLGTNSTTDRTRPTGTGSSTRTRPASTTTGYSSGMYGSGSQQTSKTPR